MGNYRITTEVAGYRADWDRLYAGYATFYKVEQTAEMRDRVWGWIGEGRILCLMALDQQGKPAGIAHIREFVRPLSATVAGYLDDLFVDPVCVAPARSMSCLPRQRRSAGSAAGR
jgi:hypothetical protein